MIHIDREHTEYRNMKRMWAMYHDLYAGGEQMKRKAGEYLLRRQKEPLDVYGERLHRAFYQNYVGSIIDWYIATLFRRPPSFSYDGGLESGKQFLSAFTEDCDRSGTKLESFYKDVFADALIFGQGHMLLDFPRVNCTPANRAEEDACGLSRAYVLRYAPEELINWSMDTEGKYEWVVLRRTVRKQIQFDSDDVVTETTWSYYDRENFKTYRRVDRGEAKGDIEITGSGTHCLSRQREVPLVTLTMPGGLWLMNKAAHLQLEHFNKSNALGWAITMGLFAMPVIYSDREWNQIVGESYYVQLGPQDKFGWAEPDGKVYQIAAANLEMLKEEIYRVCYLSQASGEMTGGHAQSAISKQMDFTITQEVLRLYGKLVKESFRKLLTLVSNAREDGVTVSVTGLDEVDISDFGTELNDAIKLLSVGIQSNTLKAHIFQRLAHKYLSDARQEIKDQIGREIAEQLNIQ